VRRRSAADQDKQGIIKCPNTCANGDVGVQGSLRRLVHGTSRLFLNLVCRTTKPSAVTSLICSAKASEIRRPVAARRPNSVAYICGLIEPVGPSCAAACTSRPAPGTERSNPVHFGRREFSRFGGYGRRLLGGEALQRADLVIPLTLNPTNAGEQLPSNFGDPVGRQIIGPMPSATCWDREFADSPLEQRRFELSVPPPCRDAGGLALLRSA